MCLRGSKPHSVHKTAFILSRYPKCLVWRITGAGFDLQPLRSVAMELEVCEGVAPFPAFAGREDPRTKHSVCSDSANSL
jgi:hypothetical protein